MAPMASLSGQTLDNTIGALFIGVFGAALIFGMTTLQAYWYFHSYPHDTHLHKRAVATLWTLDGFHLALGVHAAYTYTVTGFGEVKGLENILWSIKLQVSVNVIIVLIVHCLYTMRIWILSGYHRGILGYLVVLAVTGGFGIGVTLTSLVYTISTFPMLEQISWAITAGLGTSTCIDFVISTAMCYYLAKSKGSVIRLNSRISTIMQYTLSSGLLTSACSLAAMFSYLLLPNTFVFLAIGFFLTKVYVGSFLAFLNSREKRTSETSHTGQSDLPTWKRRIDLPTIPSFGSAEHYSTSERYSTIIGSFPSPPPHPEFKLEILS